MLLQQACCLHQQNHHLGCSVLACARQAEERVSKQKAYALLKQAIELLGGALLAAVPCNILCIACVSPSGADDVLLITVALHGNCTRSVLLTVLAREQNNMLTSMHAFDPHPVRQLACIMLKQTGNVTAGLDAGHTNLRCCLPANVSNGALMVFLFLGPIPFVAVSMPHNDQAPVHIYVQLIADLAELHAQERRTQ